MTKVAPRLTALSFLLLCGKSPQREPDRIGVLARRPTYVLRLLRGSWSLGVVPYRRPYPPKGSDMGRLRASNFLLTGSWLEVAI